jgi:hypothetical protein
MKSSHLKLIALVDCTSGTLIPTVELIKEKEILGSLILNNAAIAICANFKTPQAKREMCALLPRGGRRPQRPACISSLYLVLQGL